MQDLVTADIPKQAWDFLLVFLHERNYHEFWWWSSKRVGRKDDAWDCLTFIHPGIVHFHLNRLWFQLLFIPWHRLQFCHDSFFFIFVSRLFLADEFFLCCLTIPVSSIWQTVSFLNLFCYLFSSPLFPVVDTYSFSAGMISGILLDKCLDDSIALAMKAAIMSLKSTETVPQELRTLLSGR